MKRIVSLGKKIVALVSAMLVVSILSLLVFFMVIFRNNMYSEFEERIISVGENLPAAIAGPLNTAISISEEFSPDIIKTLNTPGAITIEKQKDVFYVILIRNNQQITNANRFNRADFQLPKGRLTKRIMRAKYPVYATELEREKLQEIRIPVVKEGKTIGEIALGYSTTRIDQVISTTLLVSILISIGFIIIVIIASFIFIRITLSNPIERLMAAAVALSSRAGDLTQKINIFTRDEIGSLAEAFNKIIDAMHDMVFQIRTNAEKVATTSQQLSSSTQEINASTQEVASAIQQLNKGATIQADRVEETFKLMQKSTLSLERVVVSGEANSFAANEISNRAERSRVVAQEAAERIEQLTTTVLDTTKVIQGLGEKSQQIGEIIETITSIADQTNLLALNAAIEAARAGEAGRGFAVVAEEVRKLAEGSAGAVKQIGSLIRSIQSETNRAVGAIEISSKDVRESRAQVVKIVEILIEISKSAQESVKTTNEITAVISEQVTENERVVSAMNEVAAIAKESASSAEEVSSSTEEQTSSMQEVSASAQELSRLAMDLKDLVGKFKTQEENT